MKFKIYTLGCKVNQYDSKELARLLKTAGWRESSKEAEQVDVIIINTCTVTTKTHGKNRRLLKRAQQKNPEAKTVLMGCWPKVYPEIKKKGLADLYWPVGSLPGLAIILTVWQKITEPLDRLIYETAILSNGFIDKESIKKQRNKWLKDNQRLIQEAQKKELQNEWKLKISKLQSDNHQLNPPQIPEKTLSLPGKNKKSRYFLKIQEGCEQFCTYCVIPRARGNLKSRSIKDLVIEAQAAEQAGYKELVLCGTNLGLYNKDRQGHLQKTDEPDLAGLIKEILRQTKQTRLRLSSIEINHVNQDILNLLAYEKRFCRHLHLPLQSGDNRLLKLMNRPYDRHYFQEKIRTIRNIAPLTALTTDVIVGFPTETTEEFMNTYNFIRKLNFSRLHVFPYSRHEQTAAAKITGHLPTSVKQKRAQQLRRLSDTLWQDYQNLVKKQQNEFEVLIEKIQANQAIGKTEFYFDLPITGIGLGRLVIGNLVKVKANQEGFYRIIS